MRNYKSAIICLILTSILLVISGCSSKSSVDTPEVDLREIEQVCELATLQGKYHGTARVEKDNPKLVSILAGKKYKLWYEYDAIYTLGIDAKEMEVTNNGTDITVKLPKAKVLSTKINWDDYLPVYNPNIINTKKIKSEAVNEAKKKAEKEVKKYTSDEALLNQARERAQIMITNQIKQIGAKVGIDYVVTFEDK